MSPALSAPSIEDWAHKARLLRAPGGYSLPYRLSLRRSAFSSFDHAWSKLITREACRKRRPRSEGPAVRVARNAGGPHPAVHMFGRLKRHLLLFPSVNLGFVTGSTDTVGLFAATVVMGMGVAVAQPAMPALVGRWLPKRLVLGTGVYTNGLLVGEILPVALPLLVPAFADNWRVTFALWAAPIVAIAVLTARRSQQL
jgi:hypothetical protein